MNISLIAAHDPDLVIGKNGRLPWHIPADLVHFKNRTRGYPVVMGRGVFEELNERPLPGRRNIVLSRTRRYDHVETYKRKEAVLSALESEPLVYIIGGEQIYREFYPVCDRLEITEIHKRYDGDTFFPEYRDQIGITWKEVQRENHGNITFVDYEKIRSGKKQTNQMLNTRMLLVLLFLFLFKSGPVFGDVPVVQPLEDYHNNILDSGGPLIAEQASVDIQFYDIHLSVTPEDSSISGHVLTRAGILEDLDVYVAHLDSVFKVSRVEVLGKNGRIRPAEFVHRNGLVVVDIPEKRHKGEMLQISIFYSGKPRPAPDPPWEGGFTWGETKTGKPWIGVSCQVNGADLWLPVKDHPSDRPDSVSLTITVPSDLTVLSNGKLRSREGTDEGKSVFHWVTNHPVSNYAITINAGPYKEISREFKSISGETFPVYFWALPESIDNAKMLLPQVKEHLAFFEDLLGPYPYRSEKYGVVESPFFGMEHQTLVAYGAGYKDDTVFDTGSEFDDLHHHELAHEWWGNLIAAYDWKDFWIHEGFATYMQPLYAEYLHGSEQYDLFMKRLYQRIENNIAVAPRESKSTREMYDGRDIYMKGAWILHSLRYLTGESDFRKILREMLYPDPALIKQSEPAPARFVDTSDFTDIVDDVTGESMHWFFETYLRHPRLPELNERVVDDTLYLSWSSPSDYTFQMPVEVFDGRNTHTIIPTMQEEGEKAVGIKDRELLRIDPGNYVLRSNMFSGN